jgi:hypothetical protein
MAGDLELKKMIEKKTNLLKQKTDIKPIEQVELNSIKNNTDTEKVDDEVKRIATDSNKDASVQKNAKDIDILALKLMELDQAFKFLLMDYKDLKSEHDLMFSKFKKYMEE